MAKNIGSVSLEKRRGADNDRGENEDLPQTTAHRIRAYTDFAQRRRRWGVSRRRNAAARPSPSAATSGSGSIGTWPLSLGA
jgi:hypothetical protein